MNNIPMKRRRILAGERWYHGTTIDQLESIRKGVNATYNKQSSIEKDFGYGFYLKATYEEAAKYICELQKALGELGDLSACIVCEFSFKPLDIFESDRFHSKLLCRYDDEFAELVFYNRCENESGNHQHAYDIIYGVESDSVPTNEMLKYKSGLSTREQVIQTLKKSTSMKQLSIHNQEICDMLKLVAVYKVEDMATSRKELEL